MKNTARAGKDAERRIREDLEANGYTCVSAHLSRGPADIIASKPGERLALQGKRSRRSGGGVGPIPWNELYDFAVQFDAIPVIAFAPPRRPVEYLRLTARKTGERGQPQPWQPLIIDFAAEAVDA